MRYLALLLVPLLLLCSCAGEEGSTVRFISVARDYSSSYITTLSNTTHDQAALSEELYYLSTGSASGYEETLFLEKDGVWTVNHVRSDWDTDSVLEALESVEADPGDLLIFHYSGHGDSSGSLVIDDSSYLSLDDLLQAVRKTGGKKLLILDSCYSGNAVTSTALSNGETFSDSKLVSSSFLKAVAESFQLLFGGGFAELEDTWVFAAVTDEQEAQDVWDTGEAGQDCYGAFTYQVLKALGYDFEEGIPGRSEETITLYGVYEAVMESISDDLKAVSTPQVTLSPIDLVLF